MSDSRANVTDISTAVQSSMSLKPPRDTKRKPEVRPDTKISLTDQVEPSMSTI